jgi:hypothetical protein
MSKTANPISDIGPLPSHRATIERFSSDSPVPVTIDLISLSFRVLIESLGRGRPIANSESSISKSSSINEKSSV